MICLCRYDISRLCCYPLVSGPKCTLLSSHNISVPNWFIMHLFCSRCKNKPCVHRVELLSNLKKKCAKLCLIQCTLLRKQYPPLYIIFKVHDFQNNHKNNTAVHTKHCETDGASAPKPSFHHKVMFFFYYSYLHSLERLASVLNWQDDSTMQSSAFIVRPRWNILSLIAYVLIVHDVIYLWDFQQSFPELL